MLRLGSIVPVDLDVVLGCISSRRVMVLVVRVCVSGRVQESPSSSFGVGHDCAGVQEDVARALDGSMDGFISVMGNVSAFEDVMLAVAVWVDEPGIVEDITVLSTREMFVSVVETSGMELGSGMFTVDECVDGEKLRRDCVCLFE